MSDMSEQKREKIEATRDEMIERAEGLRMAPNPLNPNPPSNALLEMTAMNNKSVDSVIRGIKQLAEAALNSTSSPSALIAAVEALPVTVRYYCDDCMRPLSSKWDHSADHTIHETFLLEKAAVLKLLRAAPAEEVA
jgi:hypothetical protein